MNPRIPLVSTLIFLATAAPVGASTLARSDFGDRPTFSAGGGQSLNVAFEAPVDDRLALGFVAGSRAFVGAAAEAHVRWRFWQAGRDPLAVAWIIGAQAAGPAFQNFTELEPVLGAALAYPITPQLTARATIAAGVLMLELWRPAGFELGYRLTPSMEATVGYNFRGDVAGLKLTF